MKRTYNLFLDDIRMPAECTLYRTKWMPLNRAMYTQEEWLIVRNYNEFVDTVKMKYFNDEFPRVVSFDHDLAEIHYDPSTWTESFKYHEETGHDCAKWFVQFCIDNNEELPETWVHSMNPVGADRIRQTLDDWYRYAEIKSK